VTSSRLHIARRDILQSAVSLAAAVSFGRAASADESGTTQSHVHWRTTAHEDADGDGGVRTGGSRTVRLANGYEVWVKHLGPSNGSIPVLTLHGGPGLTHFYFECFEDFLPQAGVQFWYYDQLGCGFSDQPKDPRLWNLERFTSEVEEVRAALGLDKMVLYGHSWGGMLAMEYALRHPQRLAGLVISNMAASIAKYTAYIAKLRSELPRDKLTRLAELDRARSYSTPEYEQIIDYLYHLHICRLDPWPEPVRRSVKWLSTPVYNTIQGRSEFEVTGNMRGWDRWADLPRIRTPTLILGGRYDEMNPADLREMSRLMPDARTFICPRGSHLGMYDDQQAYFSALVPFLRRVTGARA
jgi:proline iminopeptidase